MIVSMTPVVVNQVTMTFNNPTVTIHKCDHNASPQGSQFGSQWNLSVHTHNIISLGHQLGTGPKREICIILLGTRNPPIHTESE